MLMSEEEELPKAVNIRSAIAVLIVTRCSKVGRACLLRGLYNLKCSMSCIQRSENRNNQSDGIDFDSEATKGRRPYEGGNWS